ncbi:MAG: metallophosphoesterase [Prolixibacteraceae bacterium]
MKGKQYMMFVLVVIVVNLLVNLYIFSRTRAVFPQETTGWWIAAVLFWIIAFSYVIGRFIERSGAMAVAEPFIKAGSFWLGAMLYITLLFLLVDIFRGLNSLTGATKFLSFSWREGKGKAVVGLVYAVSAIILVAGFYSAKIPVVRNQMVKITKPVPGGSQKVVLVSDIHLGMMISNGKLDRMVNLVNKQNADLILMAGDVFDEDLGPVIKKNMGDQLKKLKARDGVYAILGNHEFYGGAKVAEKYLKDHNITVLRDSVVMLRNGISIVGREDITAERMYNKSRKPISELLKNVDTGKLILMLDHQPYKLKEVAEYPVDLQVSGHTHNGQMWPFNYIIDAMYEIGSGYGKIKETHFYVSSGYGTWGPPIRTNSRAEIVVLDIIGN